jgi:hypothetical protein
MKLPLTLGTTPDGDNVSLPIDALRRHMLALGASGSGKTVLCKVVVEECIRKRLPVIAVDPQGDLVSMALSEDPAVLVKMGIEPAVAREFRERVDVKVWTPGASLGIPVSFTPNMRVPDGVRPEDRLRAFGAVAQALASTAFSMILEYADRTGLACENLEDFKNFLGDPPMPLAREMDVVFDGKARAKAHKALLIKTLGANRLMFDLGKPIDIDEMFGLYTGGPADNRKARLSVIYLNTLTSQEDKEIFVSLLCSALYQWMLTLDGSQLWGMFYMDEVAPYLPPVRNPASKQALMMLLRQARKYGLCCLLATQSPGDIDYKALGQVGTMALGRIVGERALGKVEPVLRAQPNLDTEAIINGLPGMPKGRFVLVNPDVFEHPVEAQVRWLVTRHVNVPADRVPDLVTDEDRENFG